jgi:DNA (cytosine-5)-methyltransferase 1
MIDRDGYYGVGRELMVEKHAAAHRRGYYHLADLFSGCGGLTLGFDRAGFRCVSAVEADGDARQSHRTNFAGRVPEGQYAIYDDIVATSPADAVRHLHPLAPERCVDVIVGGPPCQAFSRLGRAALWDLAGKANAHHDDPRATLYERFLVYLATLKPLAFVIENVKEMGRYGSKNVAHEIAATTETLGYTTRYAILNAVWYGVPQLRERLVIIGIHRSLNLAPRFPAIRFAYDLPPGYATSRAGTGKVEVLPPHDYYVDHYEKVDELLPGVTAAAAFADLPPITRHLDGGRTHEEPQRLGEMVKHMEGVREPFIYEMRDWPGFKSDGSSSGHVIRFTPRDYEIFRRMPHGGMYPDALRIAEEIFQERLSAEEERLGHPIPKGSPSPLWLELRRRSVPPYKGDSFPNKFRKMWSDQPARTVAAHLGKDSYSHIHYDSDQARCISMREAARLQSFPDAFAFSGSMNAQLRQIGNAVPPLLAFAVAEQLRCTLASPSTTNRGPEDDASGCLPGDAHATIIT